MIHILPSGGLHISPNQKYNADFSLFYETLERVSVNFKLIFYLNNVCK